MEEADGLESEGGACQRPQLEKDGHFDISDCELVDEEDIFSNGHVRVLKLQWNKCDYQARLKTELKYSKSDENNTSVKAVVE